MKKKLIIHIGTPKTGSSFLQELCIKNHGKLFDLGVLYPGIDQSGFIKKANIPINGSRILSFFTDNSDREVICNLIIKDFDSLYEFNVNTILISDETFSAFNVLNKGNLFIFECLIEVCHRLNIELSFLAYYRQPSKYLPSHWAQLVKKHKETLPLIEFIKQKIPYWNNLIALHKLYDKVSIYSYDKEIVLENGFSKSFFDAIGINFEGLDCLPNTAVNSSLSLNCLSAMRLINAEFDDETINKVESILTNSIPKNKLNKPKLSKEVTLFVDELYVKEMTFLDTISCSK